MTSAVDPAKTPAVTDADRVGEWFRYHSPTADQIPRYQTVRDTAKSLAHVLLEHVPPCADRTAALRKLRECVMTANAAIACDGV